ncbi:MAG: ABC transporter ATP-binding protein [Gemmatimonadota bacterium]
MSADAGSSGPPAFRARDLSFRYPGAPSPAVVDVDLTVPKGSFYGVIGPNGSGKTTLLRLLLGTLTPGAGRITFAGRSLEGRDRRELARRIGVVPQSETVPFPLTVRDLVAMGRYPHLGAWRSEGEADRTAVRRALARCRLEGFEGRLLETLSGGEAQLARVARALAQEPEVLVLDEPAASLDLRHEMEIYRLLRRLVSDRAVTVLVVTHHLNVAARFADRLLLLDRGGAAAEGEPGAVLRREIVTSVYDWPVRIVEHPGPGPDEGAPQIVPLSSPPGATGADPVNRRSEPSSTPCEEDPA